MGLDLESKDIPLYISEHYGENKDTKRIKTKFSSMLSLLKKVFLEEYTNVQWNKLVDINIKKSDDTKSEEEKADINFIIPNKPMYRIFELNDMEQLNIMPTTVEEGAKEMKSGDASTVNASTTIENNSKQIEIQKKTRSQKTVAERAEEIMKHYGEINLEKNLKNKYLLEKSFQGLIIIYPY